MKEKKVFCIGYFKTGTTSIEESLKILGYHVCRGHWKNPYSQYLLALWCNDDVNRIMRVTKQFDAFADTPWFLPNVYQESVKQYPESKYILTIRDPEDWYNSLLNYFNAECSADAKNAFEKAEETWRFGIAEVMKKLFNAENLVNKDAIMQKYSEDNNKAIQFFESINKPILVLDISKNSGSENWKQISNYLELPIPEKQFPHSNRGKYVKNSEIPSEPNDRPPNTKTVLRKFITKFLPKSLRHRIKKIIREVR